MCHYLYNRNLFFFFLCQLTLLANTLFGNGNYDNFLPNPSYPPEIRITLKIKIPFSSYHSQRQWLSELTHNAHHHCQNKKKTWEVLAYYFGQLNTREDQRIKIWIIPRGCYAYYDGDGIADVETVSWIVINRERKQCWKL